MGLPMRGTSASAIFWVRRPWRDPPAPRSKEDWNGLFYQYRNRLAFQYFLRRLNGIDSSLVFLYFANAVDMDGPTTEAEWHGAVRLTHACLGLPADLSQLGVHKAFVDARSPTDQG
jgi:hypothetical protein